MRWDSIIKMRQVKKLLKVFLNQKYRVSLSIFLIVILPVVGLIHLSSEKMYRNMFKFMDVKKDTALADVEIAISDLIFSLQKERGRTQLYLARSDAERRSKLLSIYENTDQKIIVTMRKIDNLNTKGFFSDKATKINEIKEEIKHVREKTQNGKVNSEEAFDFYKNLITELMEIRYSLIHHIKDRELLASLFKNMILSEIVEACGQERALVSFQIASGKKDNSYIEKIKQAHSNEMFFEDLYLKLASNEERQSFMKLKESSKIEEIKNSLLLKSNKNGDDGEYWWKISTERIEAIISLIKFNLEELKTRLNLIKKNSFRGLAVSSLQLTLTLILTVLIAIKAVKYIEGQIFYDLLTGLPNRKFFSKELEIALNRAERYGETFSLAIFDIDDFKYINDNYGHDSGDIVLREVGNIIRKNIRKSDIAARYGGEEFIVLFPNTSIEDAYKVSERIRKSIESRDFNINDTKAKVSISGGITSYLKDSDIESLIKEADEALYEAKRSGKNKIVINEKEQKGGHVCD